MEQYRKFPEASVVFKHNQTETEELLCLRVYFGHIEPKIPCDGKTSPIFQRTN